MSANISHASQRPRPVLGTGLEGLLVDSTPRSGSGGGEGVVSLMPRRQSEPTGHFVQAWFRLGERVRVSSVSSSTNFPAIAYVSFTSRHLRVTKPSVHLR